MRLVILLRLAGSFIQQLLAHLEEHFCWSFLSPVLLTPHDRPAQVERSRAYRITRSARASTFGGIASRF